MEGFVAINESAYIHTLETSRSASHPPAVRSTFYLEKQALFLNREVPYTPEYRKMSVFDRQLNCISNLLNPPIKKIIIVF